MSSWRDQILNEFTPHVARLTIVADPDGVLLEEGILEGIREKGFELIPFDDHIAFRYAYESKFRSRWDRGEQTELVVALRTDAGNLAALPYDLVVAGRKLAFHLGDIFPNLSYPVVSALDRGHLDTLYDAQLRYAPGQLGDNATKEFILRHVFEIAPELIKQPSDLLRVLLRRHYRGERVPKNLDDRFIQLLLQSGYFEDWPLDELVKDRERFFAFLQERWLIFLEKQENAGLTARDGVEQYGLTIKGPLDLPFDHDDIRVYVDNLFVEGLLQPVAVATHEGLSETWMGIGIRGKSQQQDAKNRLPKLLETIRQSVPASDAKHMEWLQFARKWAELIHLLCQQPSSAEKAQEDTGDLKSLVDTAFTDWVTKRYAGLINLPPVPPVMLHHLPRFLAREMCDNDCSRIAFVVIDGLAMDQWLIVRDVLQSRQTGLRFRETTVFAWAPSLTSVSRQAAFSGKPPIFFPNSIQTTDKESDLWTQFWADNGLGSSEVVYVKGLGDAMSDTLLADIARPKVRVAGMVVDKVDRIMHGMEMGTAGMHNQVRQWAMAPFLGDLLEALCDNGFLVYLTSDHGNIEARGCGRPSEGCVADVRGERVRIYPDATLRSNVKAHFPAALEWDITGLPENYFPLMAPPRQAFIRKDEKTVCHGGLSVEELIVPLVKVERKRK